MGGQDRSTDRGQAAPVKTGNETGNGTGERKAWRQRPDLDPQSRTDLGGFAEGTDIDTVAGPCQIEHLQPGDLIRTAEYGPLPVQQIWAIPDDLAPNSLLRLRVSGPGGGAPGGIGGGTALYVLPSQCLRLTHWLCQRLFQAEAVLLRLGDLKQPGPADPVARHERQIYRLELGVACGITAGGHACGLLSATGQMPDPVPGQMTRLRLLTSDDARFLMASSSITRPRGLRP